jgi:ubiquinone/menaquinone biosynthesis C-methylase UbiE
VIVIVQDSSWGAYYHAIAPQMSLYQDSNRHLIDLATLRPGMSVVDLGSGSGLTAQAALAAVPEGLHLTLIDMRSSMIAQAKAVLGNRVQAYHVAPAEEAAASVEAKVDRVICNMAFWYFRNPERVLAQVRQMLKPNGRFIFNLIGTFFNTSGGVVSPQWALMRLLHEQGYDVRPIVDVERLPNQRSIEAMLVKAGYKMLQYDMHELQVDRAETEPGGELYNLMRLAPVLQGATQEEAIDRSLAILPEVAGALQGAKARWRTANFVAMPTLSPEEIFRLKFGDKFPVK